MYKTLMQQKVEWMIQRWMEDTNSTQSEIQTLLDKTLIRLTPTQQPPEIQPSDDPQDDLSQWQKAWAERLILGSDRFTEMLWMYGMQDSEFPVEPLSSSHPEFQDLLDLHQEIYLEEWLTILTP